MQEFFLNEEANAMRDKLFEAIDPNNDYTYEQFMTDYGSNSTLTINSKEQDYSYKISFNFVNESDNPDPTYQTDGSSGFDLRANIPNDSPSINVKSGDFTIISTGLYFEIPPNFEIQIRPRSGLAAKYGITVLNSPGTIDSDYRGELKVILINHGKKDFQINHGDRIAQAVIANVTTNNFINLNKVNEISNDTKRGTGGFGSTGTK